MASEPTTCSAAATATCRREVTPDLFSGVDGLDGWGLVAPAARRLRETASRLLDEMDHRPTGPGVYPSAGPGDPVTALSFAEGTTRPGLLDEYLARSREELSVLLAGAGRALRPDARQSVEGGLAAIAAGAADRADRRVHVPPAIAGRSGPAGEPAGLASRGDPFDALRAAAADGPARRVGRTGEGLCVDDASDAPPPRARRVGLGKNCAATDKVRGDTNGSWT